MRVLPVILIAASLGAHEAGARGKRNLQCFRASTFDLDGDRWAAAGSPPVDLEVDASNYYTCPAGWVPAADDCADRTSGTRPLRAEAAFNGRDDDCNGDADETEAANEVSVARTKILLSAFRQLSDHERGQVGVNGSVHINGTRYGAPLNDQWCSEFYVWNATPVLDGISGLVNTSGLRTYFGTRYRSVRQSSFLTDIADLKRADWLGLDTNSDGTTNHTGMFLAYRASDNKIVAIEGNANNNRVRLKFRDAAQLKGYGHITGGLLK
jgi:hypothetical protein